MAEENGYVLHGIYLGYKAKPWTSDETKHNHEIYIQVGTKEEAWGEEKPIVETVSIFGDVAICFYEDKNDELKGRRVNLPVVVDIKSGQNARGHYAFKTVRMLKDTLVRVMKEPKAA